MRALSLAPALAVLVGLFWTGLTLAIIRAMGIYPALGMNALTFKFFSKAIADSSFSASLALTGRVSILSTAIAATLGSALAIAAAIGTRPSRRLRIGMQLPLYLPHLVAANMILLVFGQSGLFPRLLHALGLIGDMEDLPSLVYDEYGIGIALGFALKETPFVAVLVYPFALSTYATFGKVAKSLGAQTRTLIWRVVLPMTWPAIGTAAIIVFAYSFSSFEVPYVLGRTYPKVLSNTAYDLYTSVDPENRPVAMALGLIIAFINGVLALGYFYMSKRYETVLAQIRGGPAT